MTDKITRAEIPFPKTAYEYKEFREMLQECSFRCKVCSWIGGFVPCKEHRRRLEILIDKINEKVKNV